jgi:hypothetical protein
LNKRKLAYRIYVILVGNKGFLKKLNSFIIRISLSLPCLIMLFFVELLTYFSFPFFILLLFSRQPFAFPIQSIAGKGKPNKRTATEKQKRIRIK